MAEKTNPKNISTLSSLVNVKKISDNPEITIDKDLNCLNYSYLVTATDFNNTDEYRNYKIKLKTITDYIIEKDASFYSQFLGMFNHYVKSLKGDNFIIVKRTHPNDDSSNILLSYEYVIEPELSRIERAEYKQYVETGEDGFVYDDTIQQNNNYPFEVAYMNKLTPGIITAEVLEEYMETTIERIIGVPNTYGQQTPIIDSIKEFVDWFWGYVRDNEEYGSLSYLIRTIEKKDEYIRQLSYDYTDLNKIYAYAYTNEQLDNTLDSLNAELYAPTTPKTYFITGIKQTDGLITDITYAESEGVLIDNDPDRITLNINGIKYILGINENGELGFDKLLDLVFTPTVSENGGSHEYMSSTPTTAKISYTVSKSAVVAWKHSNTYTYISSPFTINLNNTSNNSYELWAFPTDNYSIKKGTVQVPFNQYKYWYKTDTTQYTSSVDIQSFINECNSGMNSSGYPSILSFNDTDVSGGKFLYILIKDKGNKKFYIGPGATEKGQMAGGMTLVKDNITTIYDSSKKYQLWRSTDPQTGGCNIQITD